MERSIGDINEKGSGLENLSTLSNQNAPLNAIQDSKISRVVSQGGSLEAVLLETEQHPYRALQYLLGDVLVMLHTAASQSTKPRCVETVKTAANYTKRIYRIHRSFFRTRGVVDLHARCEIIEVKGYIRDVLKKAGERLTLNKSLTNFLSLHGIREVLKEPTELLAEAHEHLTNFTAGNIKEVSSK